MANKEKTVKPNALAKSEESFLDGIAGLVEKPDSQGESFVTSVQNPALYAEDGFNAEIFYTLPTGKQLQGFLRGNSEEIEMENDGKKVMVKTWLVEVRPGIVVKMLGSTGLDSKLDKIEVGSKVIIQRFDQQETRSKRRVNVYNVLWKKVDVKALKGKE